jgi:polyphosphate kinase
VKIDLVVRGICCLRPGVPGLSENIRVKSIVGRFLEHSRIVCLRQRPRLPSRKAQGVHLLGRLDAAQPRPPGRGPGADRLNPTVHQQVLDQIMVANLKDEAQSWTLDAEGNYTRLPTSPDAFSAHMYFMTNPSLSGRGSALKRAAGVTPTLVLRKG